MDYAKLIRKCKSNDRKAQHQLFEIHADKMYIVAFRYVRNHYAAEEAVTNSFLKIFRSMENFHFEGEAKFQAWIRRIVVNEALMEIRRVKQLPVFIDELPEVVSSAESGDNIYFDELVLLIDRLPEGYQMVFRLFVIEGYNHAEIAEQLGITEGTSKSQLHKARQQLQQMLIKNERL
ncbi:MAG: sigma-70 family RNA polymerase sigma factor [Prolixibacteraceae bacterium]